MSFLQVIANVLKEGFMSSPFYMDDESDYLVHLVGKDEPYNTFMSILSSGLIKAHNAFGYQPQLHQKKAVCFSEIPPNYLQKLVRRRYNHGIAFKRDLLIKNGAQRVWYLEKDSREHQSLEILSKHLESKHKKDLLNLTPYIDVSGDYGHAIYRFEWEREWRLLSSFSFSPSDVAFLILPGDIHKLARDFFQDAELEQLGPNYSCPYYDPITNIYSE